MGSNQRGSDQKAMQLIVGLTIAFAISLLAGYGFIRSMMTMPGDGGGDRLTNTPTAQP